MRKQFAAIMLAGAVAVSGTASYSTIAFAEAETASAEEETASAEEETAAESYDFSAPYEENGYYKDITALDYVTLPEYIGIKVPSSSAIPDDSKVEEQISSDLSAYETSAQLLEGTVEDGDTINIDYVGSIDGVEFEGGSTQGNGTTVTIGTTNYIDDFLQQLIGHSVGETVNVEVTFPDDYGKEELNGKDALFVVTINSKTHTTTPELTDEFVLENFSMDSVEAYRQSIYDDLLNTNIMNFVMSELLNNSVVSEVPESVVDTCYDYEFQYLSTMVMYYGIDVETYLSYYSMTLDDLRTYSEQLAEQNLIYQAVAEAENITFDDAKVMEMIGVDEETYQSYVEYYGIGYIYNSVLPNFVAEYLTDLAVVSEEEEISETTAEEISETAEEETEVVTTAE